MWDIDSPPAPGGYYSIGDFKNRPSRIRTIDMNGLTALTVFYDEEGIIGIHGHHGNDSAMTTFENLHETRQQQCTWRYFPLQAGEEIVTIWVLRGISVYDNPILAVLISKKPYPARVLTFCR